MASNSIIASAGCYSPHSEDPIYTGCDSVAAQPWTLFRRAVLGSRCEESLLRAFVSWIPSHHRVKYFAIVRWGVQAEPTWRPLHSEIGDLPETIQRQLIDLAGERGAERVVLVEPASDNSQHFVAMAHIPGTPIPCEALVVVAQQGNVAHRELPSTLALAATSLWMWRLRAQVTKVQLENRAAMALVELVDRIAACSNLQLACDTLVQSLQDYLKCHRVIIGLCPSPERACRIASDSQHADTTGGEDHETHIQAAIDEVILRDSFTVWPAPEESERHRMLAVKQLAEKTGSAGVIGAPVRDEQGTLRGAWLLMGDVEFSRNEARRNFIRAAERSVGTSLGIQQRLESGRMLRWFANASEWSKRWPGRLTLAACVMLVLLLACPATYRVKCDCKLQPVTRRFVAAPFDGKLERSFVESGDLVGGDQLLASMDGREIRWELAGVVAEAARAQKQLDGYLAAGEFGAAELTKYEIERLRLKTQLLENRSDNLDIQSPLDGIVIGGDLKKVEGAPVQVGQTLFEIAPLDKMIVEISIPDQDIMHVLAGANVEVSLDAFPSKRWQGTLARIHPRSEVNEGEHVFLGEMVLETSQDTLRPGMRGRARIVGPRRSWAWILLHKPWEKLLLWWGW